MPTVRANGIDICYELLGESLPADRRGLPVNLEAIDPFA